MRNLALALLIGMGVCGCGTTYVWQPTVPKDYRSVSVPTFRNNTDLMELGPIATQQVLREFQREGAFTIKAVGDSALEVQGIIKSVGSSNSAYDRRYGLRHSAYDMEVVAEVSVIDKRASKVLINNRLYRATATFTAGQDLTTAQRGASNRVMEDLARQIVDDVLNIKWEKVDHE